MSESSAVHPIRFDRRPDVDGAEWYRDESGAFTAGFWTHESGVLELDVTEHEFCLLLAGKVRLTAADGQIEDFGMGDGFIIPGGFKGTWETVKPVRKWYVTWQPAS
jgi:uncharacterized cupin superfamily protein